MSRNEAAAVTSISQYPQVRYRLLVEVYSLASGTTRACSGENYIVFGGNTYAPVGTLGGIEKIQEDSDVFPRAVRLTFAAVSSAQIADVLGETIFNKPVRIKRTFLTDSLTCVSTPETLFSGRINTCQMKLGDQRRGDYFEIEVESRLRRSPRAQYFNRETLWTVYAQSGDMFFDWMTKVPFVKANWGGNEPVDFNPGAPVVPVIRPDDWQNPN
jgi:hypothetical protein